MDAVRNFPGTAESVADARAFVRECITGPERYDAILLVSELAGNVVRHVGGDYSVSVEHRDGFVRVFVRDSGALTVPMPRPASDSREGGRGLALVEAYASAWGSEITAGGRVVWFDLPVTVAAEAA